MNTTRVPVTLIAAALALGVPIGQPEAGAATRGFRVYQMNMCMTGSPHYLKSAKNGRSGSATCFPNPYVTKDKKGGLHYKAGFAARERKIAGQKRAAVIRQIERYTPTAVTLNEVCKYDVNRIVGRLRAAGHAYTFKAHEVDRGRKSHPVRCSAERGPSVNAIIAHRFVSGSKQGGYFEKNGYRSWLCARVTAGHVRVCTAHLSGPASHWGGRRHQPIECAKMRRILRSTSRDTVFGGDVNMKRPRQGCDPSKDWGLQDVDTHASARTPRSGLQHIYYSPDFTRGSTCGAVHAVPHTDHKGFLLDLKPTAHRVRGKACTWRDVKK